MRDDALLATIMNQTVAVVPARAGSTRVKDKNLAIVGGKSLVHRAIDVGRQLASSVILSTDIDVLLTGPEIERVKVIGRPPDLAGSDVTMDDVLMKLITECEILMSAEFVLLLQPTSPFRKVSQIIESLKILENTPNADMIFSVHLFLEDLWDADENGNLSRVFKDARLQQLRKKRYVENGNFYIFRRTSFIERGALSQLRSVGFVLDGDMTIDINDESDLRYAQFISNQ